MCTRVRFQTLPSEAYLWFAGPFDLLCVEALTCQYHEFIGCGFQTGSYKNEFLPARLAIRQKVTAPRRHPNLLQEAPSWTSRAYTDYVYVRLCYRSTGRASTLCCICMLDKLCT